MIAPKQRKTFVAERGCCSFAANAPLRGVCIGPIMRALRLLGLGLLVQAAKLPQVGLKCDPAARELVD